VGALSGLNSRAASKVVKPARVAECHLGCSSAGRCQVMPDEPGRAAGGNIVIRAGGARVGGGGLVNERHHVDAAKLDAVGRLGDLQYCTTRERF